MRTPPLLLLPFLLPALPAQRLEPMPGPQPTRAPEAMAYDSLRDYSVGVGLDGRVWKHDGAQWSELLTKTTLPLRYEAGIAFDGLRVLVYGGQGASAALGDFWAYDGVDWRQLSAAGGPGLRRGHAMAYDDARKQLILHGGTDMRGNFFSDTWAWDGTAWTQVAVPGPSSRVWHRMVYDPLRQRIVLFGGALNPIFYYDTWEWDGKGWTQTVAAGAPGRALSGAVFDSVTQRVLALAGQTKNGPIAGVDAYDPVAGAWLPVVQSLGVGWVFGACHDSRRGRTVIAEDSLRNVRGHFFLDGGPGTFTRLGDGCPGGQGQVPVLAAARASWPVRGTTFAVEVRRVGQARNVLLATGLSDTTWGSLTLPLPLPGMPGCLLRVSPEIVLALPVNAGVALLSVQVPSTVPAGFTYYQQAMTLDPTATNGVGGVSNGGVGVVR